MTEQKTEQKTLRDDSHTSETAEFWRDVKEARQEKRASNRENSAAVLAEAGIPFQSKNIGAHLIVEGPVCFIDFWPGTGRWISRKGTKGFGVRNLIKHINAALQSAQPAAAVSDEEIEEIARGKSNHIEFARAILALRPQAVPMDQEAAWGVSPVNSEWEAVDAYMQGIADAEAHHGITQRADGGEG